MPTPSTLAVFCLAALALLIVPGPSVLFIVGRSIEQGRTAGLVSVLGIHAGTLVHVTAATVGLSALLVRSALVFTAVKWLGAAYLVWLGVRAMRRGGPDTDAAEVAPRRRYGSLRRTFGEAVVVNVLNPKTALFFLAFLPQFVEPDRGSVTVQVAVLGATFALLGLLSDGCYALGAAAVAAWVRRRGRGWASRRRYLTGGLYVALGVGAALSDARPATS